ncbi:MAG: penicillin-binding protein 2 [Treponema sp.]|nr:penicillin-binding protein 2 [Treponema sp.]
MIRRQFDQDYNSGAEGEKNVKLLFLVILLVILFCVYAFKLLSIQVINGEKYRTQSKNISSRITTIPAQRGEIFDRNANMPLVVNTESFAVSITPGEIPSGRYDNVASKLAQIMGIKKTDIDAKIPKNYRRSFTARTIKSNVPFSIISNIAENKNDLPGVSWESTPIRNYVESGSLSHIIGYVGDISEEEYTQMYNRGYDKRRQVGKTGIEKQYDHLLQGIPGQESRTVDVRGRVLSDAPVVTEPQMGKNLVLTIDTRIQELVEKTLGERVGASVVLKPSTGEVLAMVSYPFYDTNLFNRDTASEEYAALRNDKNNPFLNRAVMTSYAPASTFKIVMSTALLQEKTFPSGKKIECNGRIFYGGHTYHCHQLWGHGWLDLKEALAESCDVYYYTVGRDSLGIEKIAEYARKFGLGQSAEIDLPSQAKGLVPTPVWKERTRHSKWVGGDTISVSIGQGDLTATPLQLADMIAMVSNKGTVYKPHLLKEVRDPVTNEVIQETKPEVLHHPEDIDEEVWTEMQEYLHYTATNGSAKFPMTLLNVPIACKTGTGEVDKYKNSKENHWHSWLVAYAPYDAPPEERICIATIVEAVNKWEWWAPYATCIIFQGIFEDQTYEEAFDALKLGRYLGQPAVRRD